MIGHANRGGAADAAQCDRSLAVLGGLALLGVRVLQAWRDLKRFRRHLSRELEQLAERAETTAVKVESASDTEELEGSVGRLRRSLAMLAVLRAELDDVSAIVGGVRAFFPRA